MATKVYDPKKEYEWDENDTFKMTGMQFASFYHLLMREMNNQGGANMAIKVEAYQVMMRIFMEGIATGQVWEKVQTLPKTTDVATDPAINNLFAK